MKLTVMMTCEMAAHYKMKYGLEGSEKSLTITSKRVSKTVDYSEDIRSSSTDKSLIGSLPKLLADNLDESKTMMMMMMMMVMMMTMTFLV